MVVEFFGDHTIAHVQLKNIQPFEAHIPKPSKRKLFQTALAEAQASLPNKDSGVASDDAKWEALRAEFEKMEKDAEMLRVDRIM